MGRSSRSRSASGGSSKDMLVTNSEDGNHKKVLVSQATVAAKTTTTSNTLSGLESTKKLFDHVLEWRDASGKPMLIAAPSSDPSRRRQCLAVTAALLDRSMQWDAKYRLNNNNLKSHQGSSSSSSTLSMRRRLVLSSDLESSYTALHWAVYEGDVAAILLLLRHAMYECGGGGTGTGTGTTEGDAVISTNTTLTVACPATTSTTASSTPSRSSMNKSIQRLTQRPMSLIFPPHIKGSPNDTSKSSASHYSSTILTAMVSAKDAEGMTAAELLLAQQRDELLACRLRLPRPKISSTGGFAATSSGAATAAETRRRRSRGNSFDIRGDQDDPHTMNDEQNELDLLSRSFQEAQSRWRRSDSTSDQTEDTDDGTPNTTTTTYGCEVVTFGRAHHCALGVVAGGKNETGSGSGVGTTAAGGALHHHATLRPQRVQTFCQDAVRCRGTGSGGGSIGGAIAVAGATHHTLVATAVGHLYSFGLGKGGRLGTGDEAHRPLPTRVLGAITKRMVVGVAAAENHSLCVTKCGLVFAWGSNRFGQLGTSTTDASAAAHTTTTTSDSGTAGAGGGRCCLPRRVDDLKNIHCVAVAAGERHSVALSQRGEVYVWGDNTAGQLGVPGRRTAGVHFKVQRVEALWNGGGNSATGAASAQPKVAIAIAASEKATMVLTVPTSRLGLPVNAIYSWGHGSHVPCRVHFESNSRAHRLAGGVNPVAIACAKHHNVAITSDGFVYTWGFHSEPLGTIGRANASPRSNSSSTKKAAGSLAISTPQLVEGMLPENGGGVAVAVSASENHTAVVTETGALYTWGATDGKNILGHEGIRWQPNPRRVPGVHRAVAVAAAKEHTVLLIGATFPPLPPPDSQTSLEVLASRTVARHVDLFNVFPILITAERAQSRFLIDYCTEFIRRNLDGVLNVGQRSDMDCYLNEQLLACQELLSDVEQDGRCPPLLLDFITAGKKGRPSFERGVLSAFDQWIEGCQSLSSIKNSLLISSGRTKRQVSFKLTSPQSQTRKTRAPSSPNSVSFSQRSLVLAREAISMLSSSPSKESIEAKSTALNKEVRGLRKRLSQIAKLTQQAEKMESALTPEQLGKIARQPQLEADLLVLEPALEKVEERLLSLDLADQTTATPADDPAKFDNEKNPSIDDKGTMNAEEKTTLSFRCEVCGITCPDERSHELHLNGRKHRNRVAQVAEEEAKTVAASMMEERQRQQLMEETKESPQIRPAVTEPSNPWNKGNQQQVKQPFKLPPPPHPVPDTIATPTRKRSTLLDIMEEEEKQKYSSRGITSPKATKPPGSSTLKGPPVDAAFNKAPPPHRLPDTSATSPRGRSSLLDIMEEEEKQKSNKGNRNPKGTSSSPLKSPPLAGISDKAPSSLPQAKLSVSAAAQPPSSPALLLGDFLVPSSSSSSNSALKPPPGTAPAMKSPPWASAPMVRVQAPEPSDGPSYWIRGFMEESPRKEAAAPVTKETNPTPVAASVAPTKTTAPASPWGPQKRSEVKAQQAPTAVTFQDIVEEEKDFKAKQDHAYGTKSKWFIERRERAGSFTEIQTQDLRAEEERLFIEEQFRLFRQIEEELAKKAADEKAQQQKSRAKRNRTRKPKKQHSNDSQEKPSKQPNAGTASEKKQRKPSQESPSDKPTTTAASSPRQRRRKNSRGSFTPALPATVEQSDRPE